MWTLKEWSFASTDYLYLISWFENLVKQQVLRALWVHREIKFSPFARKCLPSNNVRIRMQFVCNIVRERVYSLTRPRMLFTQCSCKSELYTLSHEAEIIFSDPIIDQFVFTSYLFHLLICTHVLSPSLPLVFEDIGSPRFLNSISTYCWKCSELLTLACGLITRANIIELTELIR